MLFSHLFLSLLVFAVGIVANTEWGLRLLQRIPRWVKRLFAVLASVSLIAMLVDDLVLALIELGADVEQFKGFRDAVAVPWVSFALHTMSVFVLAPGIFSAWRSIDFVSDKSDPEITRLTIRLRIAVATLGLALVNIVTSLQILTYEGKTFGPDMLRLLRDEGQPDQLLTLLGFVVSFMSLAMPYAWLRELSHEVDERSQAGRFSIVLLRAAFVTVFVVLSESMITKATLVVLLALKVRRWVRARVSATGRTVTPSAGSFLEGIDLQPGAFKTLALYFLVGTFIHSLFFIQAQLSPFPPTAGLLPYTATYNLLITLEFVLFLAGFAAAHRRSVLVLSAAMLYSLAVRYALPFVALPLLSMPEAARRPVLIGVGDHSGVAVILLGISLFAQMFVCLLGYISEMGSHARDRFSREPTIDNLRRYVVSAHLGLYLPGFLVGHGTLSFLSFLAATSAQQVPAATGAVLLLMMAVVPAVSIVAPFEYVGRSKHRIRDQVVETYGEDRSDALLDTPWGRFFGLEGARTGLSSDQWMYVTSLAAWYVPIVIGFIAL